MKNRKTKIVLTSSLLLALFTLTRDSAMGESIAPKDQKSPEAEFWSHLGTMRKSRDLLGLTVTDKLGQTVGKIADLVVDFPAGRVACALVLPLGNDARNGYIPV